MKSDDLATLFTSLPGLGAKWFSGTVVNWDELTGSNTVLIEGAEFQDLNILSTWAIQPLQPGDTVGGFRVGSQHFILGKVGAPGAGAGNQIASDQVVPNEGTTSTTFTDLATVGPTVTVYIGSSRRALVSITSSIECAGSNPSYIGGAFGCEVSGASSIGPSFGAAEENQYSGGATIGFTRTITRLTLYTADDGLQTGINTFQMKYLSDVASTAAAFAGRTLTVFPI